VKSKGQKLVFYRGFVGLSTPGITLPLGMKTISAGICNIAKRILRHVASFIDHIAH
jgi:hypothetical protein